MWRRPISTATRWACTLLCVVIVSVWAGSLFWWASWVDPSDPWHVVLRNGAILGEWEGGRRSVSIPHMGFQLGRQPAELRRNDWWPEISNKPYRQAVSIPLWVPFLLTSIPAAWLWRADRREAGHARAGLCKTCGYDRAGLARDAKCPECGGVGVV